MNDIWGEVIDPVYGNLIDVCQMFDDNGNYIGVEYHNSRTGIVADSKLRTLTQEDRELLANDIVNKLGNVLNEGNAKSRGR